MSNRALCIVLFLLTLSGFSFSQETPKVAPLPYDPLELATGPTVVPNTPEQRTLVLNLLERARQNSAMHTPGTTPFSIKVSFNSTGGDSHSQGYGELEETWLNGQTWRWSARLGDFVGKHFGKLTAIRHDEVVITEVTQDRSTGRVFPTNLSLRMKADDSDEKTKQLLKDMSGEGGAQ